MSALGTTTLYLLLLLAVWAGALAVVGARRRSAALAHSAELLTYAVCAGATLAMLLLAYAFAVSDYSIAYVQQHSERAMPLFYRVTASWGGMEGSLLLWAWLLSVFTCLAIRSNRERLRELIPYTIFVLMVVMTFFCTLLITTSNPFEPYLSSIPAMGKGLNPLLQNPYMITHPPSLYLGFVGMAIPFAFAMAALLSGYTDNAWVMAARRWAMLAWFFLSLGLTLGMLWAYEELGWGGYWGWDPVENAGLLPWLTATAFLHSIIVQERRSMLRIWNMLLAIISFVMTIFGTFLTRSGFIDSVHAFARSPIGWVFLGFIGFVLVTGISLVVWRAPRLKSRGELESVFSREFWFLLNNWVLLSATFLVLLLTIFPTLSGAFGEKITISIPAFNRWMTPLGVALLILTGVGPMLGWRKSTAAGLRHQLQWPLVFGVIVAVALYVLGLAHVLAVIVWGLSAFVMATIAQELVRGARTRASAAGVGLVSAFFGLFARNRRRYGGYIVHAGIVLMCVGFAGDAFKVEREVVMKRGQRHTIGDYVLRYDGIKAHEDVQKQMITARLSVFVDGRHVGTLAPARWTYARHEDAPTTEVALKRSVREDLFVAFGSHDPQTGGTTFKLVINPLVSWIWIGFFVLAIGAAVAALPVGGRRAQLAAITGALAFALLSPQQARAYESGAPPPATAAGAEAKAAAKAHDHDHEIAQPLGRDGEFSLFAKLTCQCGTCPRLLLSKCGCGFAQRERAAIRKKITAGWPDSKIINWYVNERGPEIGRRPFGTQVLSVPPDRGFTRLYWLLPYALSGVAVVGLLLAGRRWLRRAKARDSAATTAERDGDASDDASDEYRNALDEELKKLED